MSVRVQSFDVDVQSSTTNLAQSLTGSSNRNAPSCMKMCSTLWTVYLAALILAAVLVHTQPDGNELELCGICGERIVDLNASFVSPEKKETTSCRLAAGYLVSAQGEECKQYQDFFIDSTVCCSHNAPELNPGSLGLGTAIALERQYVLQASTLVTLAFFAVVGCVITSSLVVASSPERTPADFVSKGTLSNVSQNISTPHGRIFSVSLFTAGLLQIFSMYTFWLYRNWAPNINFAATPFRPPHNIFEPDIERWWRTVWVTAPQVGLMFTAAIPSLSNTSGFRLALTLTHNIIAPLSMGFLMVMETVQLAYGEYAFSHFFSSDQVLVYGSNKIPVYGPLDTFQRWRVVLVVYAWISVAMFLGIQVYLGLGEVLGVQIRTSYSIAAVSFFSEITSMILIYSLPFIAGWEKRVLNDSQGLLMDEIRDTVAHGPWGPWPVSA